MKCVNCKTGNSNPGTTTVTLQRGESIIVVKEVPADVCDNCGEYYLQKEVTEKIYQQAEKAVQRKVEVEIVRYAA